MTPKSLIGPARLARRPVLATQGDGRLVDLVRAGYEPAFEAIVARYRGPLLRYVERFLPRERAEDALQQAFVNAYEAMVREGSPLELRPWLYRIAHNAALNALRDRSLRHDELFDRIDGVEPPDEAVERAQGLREVLAAVQALPVRQRDALVLRELEGRSYEEIAAELGVSGGSVRQLLHRARNTLRAGATALTPAGLVSRLPWGATGDPVAARVAELCGGAGAGAAVAKVCATALVTGAVAGGVALAPDDGADRAVGPEKAAADGADGAGGAGSRRGADDGVRTADLGGHAGDDRSGPGGGDDGSGGGDDDRRDRDDDRRGTGDGDDDRDGDSEDRSGPGDGGDNPDDVSDDGLDDGSGSGESVSVDSSGPGGGSDGSGSGSSGSGTSGSGTSGSGSSGSGSSSFDTSGSGSSGSGTSGSGTSGSGDGESIDAALVEAN